MKDKIKQKRATAEHLTRRGTPKIFLEIDKVNVIKALTIWHPRFDITFPASDIQHHYLAVEGDPHLIRHLLSSSRRRPPPHPTSDICYPAVEGDPHLIRHPI